MGTKRKIQPQNTFFFRSSESLSEELSHEEVSTNFLGKFHCDSVLSLSSPCLGQMASTFISSPLSLWRKMALMWRKLDMAVTFPLFLLSLLWIMNQSRYVCLVFTVNVSAGRYDNGRDLGHPGNEAWTGPHLSLL